MLKPAADAVTLYNKSVCLCVCLTQVHWHIQSDWDTAGDFLALSGSVVILEGQREAEIVLSLMPDTVPELEESYTVLLTAVDGGATLDANPNRVRANIRLAGRVLLNSLTYIGVWRKMSLNKSSFGSQGAS